MRLFAFLAGFTLLAAPADRPERQAEVVSLDRIWDRAPHNAFTDLILFRNRWYCVFREGSAHVSPDGAIRVLTSDDANVWTPSSRIEMPGADLRDPKLTPAPGGRLMLTAAAAYPSGSAVNHQTFVWSTGDGRSWTEPAKIGEANFWLWRLASHRGYMYSPAYQTAQDRFIRLYISRDGWSFDVHAPDIYHSGSPSEAAMMFLENENGLCLLRRDGTKAGAQLGISRAPYRSWEWSDLGVRIGGPQVLQVPDGRIVAGGRLHEPAAHTALCWLDVDQKTLTEFLSLPSKGDNSYPGLVFHEGLLYVSYYSSHERKTSIYLAKVKLPPLGAKPKKF